MNWLQEAVTGCPYFSSIQSYTSDNVPVALESDELREDILCCYDGTSCGVGIFRYGLSNFTNLEQ